MRKLLTVLVAGGLVVTLGAPAFGDSETITRSSDDQLTATRHGGDRQGGGGRYRRNPGRDGDHRGWRHRRHLWDDAVRSGHRRRSYDRYFSGFPYYYGGYYNYPTFDRRAYARERECNDAYSYDRAFYDRYCRGGSNLGRFCYRSPSGYPDPVSPPAGQPSAPPAPMSPAPDQMSAPADQTTQAPNQPTPARGQPASAAPSQNPPTAADNPSADPQPPRAEAASPSRDPSAGPKPSRSARSRSRRR